MTTATDSERDVVVIAILTQALDGWRRGLLTLGEFYDLTQVLLAPRTELVEWTEADTQIAQRLANGAER